VPVGRRAELVAPTGRHGSPDARRTLTMMGPRRTLLSPRMLLSHVLVTAVVVGLVSLGLWQLRRWDDVRALNGRLEERLATAPVPFADLPDPDVGDTAGTSSLEFRQVTATGTYATDEEVLQRGGTLGGQSGYHVLTPLVLGDGTALLVRRGWVPFALDTPPVPEAAPPSGEVTVTGWLERPGVQPSGFGQKDPETGALERVFHADPLRLDDQVTADLRAMVLHLEAQSPTQEADLPVPAPRPEFSAGTHLSYAVQWFAFAAIAATVYVLWLRKRSDRQVSRVEAPVQSG